MITVERTFTVARPVGEVFAYLTDFEHTEQWDPGTIETVRVDDDGPLRVGARFRNTSEFRGRRTVLDYELATLEHRKHLVFVGRNKTVTSADDLRFQRTGDLGRQTEITYQARFDFHGLARLAEPLLRRTFDKIADETVAQMIRTLESRDLPLPPGTRGGLEVQDVSSGEAD